MKFYRQYFYLLITILLSFYSCQNDEVESPLTNQSKKSKIELSKDNFNIIKFEDISLDQNLKVNWNEYKVLSEDELSGIYEFTTNSFSTFSWMNKDSKKKKI